MADRRAYPLKKILYSENMSDYLECGHKLPAAQDIYDYRYPEKRRCHKCAKSKPIDFEVSQNPLK